MTFAGIRRVARDYWLSVATLAVVATALGILLITSHSGHGWIDAQRAAQASFDRHLQNLDAQATAANARELAQQAASDRQAIASESVALTAANDGLSQSGPASTGLASPPDRFMDLTVLPVSPPPPSCDGLFYPGQALQLSATGFLPRTSVRVFSAAPGQAPVEEELELVRADATGAINTTVRIPLTARGFAVQGTSARLIFFYALGLGADGISHATAIDMDGLAAPDSACAATLTGR